MQRAIPMLTLALAAVALLATTAVIPGVPDPTCVALAGDAAPGKHPHFDDGGALSWTTKLADAQKAAKKAGRLILVEYGREA